MAIFTAILGWQFPLLSWRQEQGMKGGSVAAWFARLDGQAVS